LTLLRMAPFQDYFTERLRQSRVRRRIRSMPSQELVDLTKRRLPAGRQGGSGQHRALLVQSGGSTHVDEMEPRGWRPANAAIWDWAPASDSNGPEHATSAALLEDAELAPTGWFLSEPTSGPGAPLVGYATPRLLVLS
jgi:hypothetical protein